LKDEDEHSTYVVLPGFKNYIVKPDIVKSNLLQLNRIYSIEFGAQKVIVLCLLVFTFQAYRQDCETFATVTKMLIKLVTSFYQ
jgi:hypothetical protein